MNASYEVTKAAGGDVYVGPGSATLLRKVDAVVFDCDGTLIDVRDSYDATIIKTVESMLKEFFGRTLVLEGVGQEFILQMRHTGGFNSDWDLTYGLILFSTAAIERAGPGEEGEAVAALKRIVSDFASRERLEGWRSVDRYVTSARLESKAIRDMRRLLGYPGNPLTSKMAATFDQVYYGAKLYQRVYGAKPRVAYGTGLIDMEKVIVTKKVFGILTRLLGEKRIAMSTGRPYLAVEHTLGKMLDYFDRDASVYIGDGDIFRDLAPKLAKFKKPSGESLNLARRRFASRVMLYVGDSGEDRLMVRNAGAPSGTILFAGIYGSSFNEREQISYFTKTESDLIVKDVNQIPELLESAKA